jgi:hypothetical protein
LKNHPPKDAAPQSANCLKREGWRAWREQLCALKFNIAQGWRIRHARTSINEYESVEVGTQLKG